MRAPPATTAKCDSSAPLVARSLSQIPPARSLVARRGSGLERHAEHGRQPLLETLPHDVAALGQQVAVAREHDQLTRAGDHPDDRGLQRQDLVAVAVEQQERAPVEAAGHLATGRLRGERDHAGHELGRATPTRTATAPPNECPITTTRSAPAPTASWTAAATSRQHASRSFGRR